MAQRVSSVILAGGASRRMGCDKAFLDLGGRPLIAHIADRLRRVADEVVVAAGAASTLDRYATYVDRCVVDIHRGIGTLGGIHAGLTTARHDLALIVACDMPFLDPSLLSWFVDAAAQQDLVVLADAGRREPLHAVYRKSCLPAIEAAIQRGERSAIAFHDAVWTRLVSRTEIAHLDPTLASFRNVNTPQEWLRVLRVRADR